MNQLNNIMETIKMIEKEKLDIRTITMGISLLDCCDPDGKKARQKITKLLHSENFTDRENLIKLDLLTMVK